MELELLQVRGTMTSLEIAEITGKEHYNILRDIKDEISKLGTERAALIFDVSEYKDSTGRKLPMYIANVKGVLQLGARYSAEVRFKLIDKVTGNGVAEVPNQDLIDIEKDKIRLEKSKALRNLYLEIPNEKYKETLLVYSANALYDAPILELPKSERKTYTATEIGEKVGISAKRVGSIAKNKNLKTDEYGYWAFDKSKYSNKQVESFRYYDNVVDEIKKYV